MQIVDADGSISLQYGKFVFDITWIIQTSFTFSKENNRNFIKITLS